jgi:hypothetical protein
VDASQTYQDDIILDQTPPQLTRARVTRRGPRKGARTATLQVEARDSASGLSAVELRVRQRRRTAVFAIRYRERIRLSRRRSDVTAVRVSDGAGNYSGWKPVRRRPSG